MGNSKSPQSIEARRKSAKAFQQNLNSTNRLEIRSKDSNKIQEIKNKLNNIQGAGSNNADKLLNLIAFWEINKNSD